MLSYIFISLLVLNPALCQINGEFWWLHEKVAQLQHVEPPQPKFEDVNEFETDESVQIVFKDNGINLGHKSDIESKDKVLIKNKILPNIVFFEDHTKLGKPEIIKTDIVINNNTNITTYKDSITNSQDIDLQKEIITSDFLSTNKKNKDEFQFVFPQNSEQSWEDKIKNYNIKDDVSKESNLTNGNNKLKNSSKIVLNDKIWFEDDKKHTETESICTFVTQQECVLRKGFIHMLGLCPKNGVTDTRKICCILPLTSQKHKNFHTLPKRYKRSDPGETMSAALKQRKALLLQKYNPYAQQVKLATTTMRTKPVQKIVTPEDYVDPYWNIKNAKFRNPNKQSTGNQDYQNTKYDGTQDYEDYGVELPKPGLVGLYSDRDDRVTSWKLKTNKGFSYGVVDEESDEDDGGGFGYSTIDPRHGKRKSTASKPIRRHPQRLMTPSINNDATETSSESHTVHFHSTPDFRVLEGFKLVNMAENKNRIRKTTTNENFYPSEEELSIEHTSPYVTNPDFDYDDEVDINQQVFKNCGTENIKTVSDAGYGRTVTDSRSDPWLTLVVLTKNPQNVLCYATIVHPSAAITAANCVHGKSTGEISAIAGVWDLKDRIKSQHRMASVHIHPQFTPDDLANDLALLHWKRPLRLQPKVVPACLADPHVGDDCYFVGWSGFDQALQQHPQWQRATILSPRSCNERVSSPDVEVPAGAFCASVETRGTVTGVGGPLLCKGRRRVSVVGVAVYREDVVILLPALEWVVSALRELQIN